MLTKYHKTITGGGKTVDAVQRILAIAERERRKRAVKEEANKASLQTVVLDTRQNPHHLKNLPDSESKNGSFQVAEDIGCSLSQS